MFQKAEFVKLNEYNFYKTFRISEEVIIDSEE